MHPSEPIIIRRIIKGYPRHTSAWNVALLPVDFDRSNTLHPSCPPCLWVGETHTFEGNGVRTKRGLSFIERLINAPLQLLKDEGMPDQYDEEAKAGIMWRKMQGKDAIENSLAIAIYKLNN